MIPDNTIQDPMKMFAKGKMLGTLMGNHMIKPAGLAGITHRYKL